MEPITADAVRDALAEVLGDVNRNVFETLVTMVVEVANASLRGGAR